ncbi:hypothetical protein CK203_107928 [Vitis vinifera]|uniref:Uncharacterized protein n=1 Tax=Vitis vinifera TaxID=29760 RepID=A0A438DCW4_VITVI|nr:hypothetical protein CK203_107928 [Vitis vinifera]
MEPLVKVLKLVDQDKKSTLSIIYEVIDGANWLSRHRSSNGKSIGKSLIEGGKVNCIDICMLQWGHRGVGGTDEGTRGDGSIGGGYVSQVDPGMSWAQGNENYYATQDTDHGYRPGIWEQQSIWKD